MNSFCQIGFIGAGNMAWAIANSVVSKGLYKANEIIVSARSQASLQRWKAGGFHVTLQNCKVLASGLITFIAIKPQQFDDMVSSLHGDDVRLKTHLFASVMAAVSIEYITEKLKPIVGNLEVIRIMPNTPLMVGHGCSVICHSGDVIESFEESVIKIMSAGGTCDVVTESQMNAVTAISGSGPAYIYLIIEALADGGVKCGLPRALAQKLANETVIGAGYMVKETGNHPGFLKDQVCSPGGTTIHAMHALESAGVRAGMINAVEAAYNRAGSLH